MYVVKSAGEHVESIDISKNFQFATEERTRIKAEAETKEINVIFEST